MWQQILKHKRVILIILAVVIAGAAAYYLQNGNKKPAQASQTVKVSRGKIVATVAATGTIKPVNMVDISSKITAQIKEVRVSENQPVKAGQVLVVLEDTAFQAQLIASQERLNNAAVNYQRTRHLAEIGAASQQQLDNSRMEYNIAQANYDEVLSKLNETVITAPIDGIVIGKTLPVGQTVAQGVTNPTVILTIADMSKMQIEAQVDETDIGKIAAGQKVSFTVDAYPDKVFSGVVANVSQKAVTQSNVTYYPITIDVIDGEGLLKPSMTARVSILVGEKNDALILPLSAIKSDKNGKYVIVATSEGKNKNVPVTIGIIGDDKAEIVTGVNEGDVVVVSSTSPAQSSAGQTGGQRAGSTGAKSVGGMMRGL